MGCHPDVNETLPDNAAVLEVVRIVDGALRTYTPMTNYDHPRRFCYTALNRVRATNGLTECGAEDEFALVDVKDMEGKDIVAEFALNKKGYDYLRSQLGFEWENREEWETNANNNAD